MRALRQLNWPNIGFLLLSPIFACIAVALYAREQGVHYGDVLNLAAMTTLTGLAITAGYHRYYSHRSYECHPAVQLYYLLFGAAALQAPLLVWASDHRLHHRFVDRECDPYCAKKGFFWAHVGWIMYRDERPRQLDNVLDLQRKPFVSLQQRLHLPLGLAIGLGVPFVIGLGFDRPWGGVIWGGLLRTVVAQHGTFLVNSAGHFFGHQPYSTANSSRDSAVLAMLTLGEGHHNFHHAFPGDYRNGARWHQWDPTKWLIFALWSVGLASGLRRTPAGLLSARRSAADQAAPASLHDRP